MSEWIFETERLYVRRFTKMDDESFFHLNNDPDIMLYIRKPKSREECTHYLMENIADYDRFPMTGRWALLEKGSDRFVGSFSIVPLEGTDDWQIGYALLKDDWNKGYATEVVNGGIQYVFEKMKLSKIMAVTELPNTSSQNVLNKTGFLPKSVFSEHEEDLYLYELKAEACS